MGIKVEVKGKKLIIEADIEDGQLSGSVKNFVIASTGGNKPTEAKYKGKTVTVGLNAYYPNEDFKK